LVNQVSYILECALLDCRVVQKCKHHTVKLL